MTFRPVPSAEYTRRQVRFAVKAAKNNSLNRSQEAEELLSVKNRLVWLTIRTLEKNLRPIGGKLRFVIEFPDKPGVTLSLDGRLISQRKQLIR